MFTVLSNTRHSNLYLVGALAILAVALLSLAVVPAISAPKSALIPATGNSRAASDYYQRHSWLGPSGATVRTAAEDFYLRHLARTSSSGTASISVNGLANTSDYFERHAELNVSVPSEVDMTDYFTRHSEFGLPAPLIESSDYFLRH